MCPSQKQSSNIMKIVLRKKYSGEGWPIKGRLMPWSHLSPKVICRIGVVGYIGLLSMKLDFTNVKPSRCIQCKCDCMFRQNNWTQQRLIETRVERCQDRVPSSHSPLHCSINHFPPDWLCIYTSSGWIYSLTPRICGCNMKTSSNGNIFLVTGPFVRGIHRSPVNSPHKSQWRGAMMFSLICALNKRLSNQSWGWWFETPSRSSWRHCSEILKYIFSNSYQGYLLWALPVQLPSGEFHNTSVLVSLQWSRY